MAQTSFDVYRLNETKCHVKARYDQYAYLIPFETTSAGKIPLDPERANKQTPAPLSSYKCQHVPKSRTCLVASDGYHF